MEKSFFLSFFPNKALACPLCGLQCWIKTCFHLSPSFSLHQPPLHQLSVKFCYETHTDLRVCVCVALRVCVLCNGCPFGRQQYWSTSQWNRTIIELLKNTLIWLWNTLAFFSPLALPSSLSSSLTLILSLHTYTHTHAQTQCRMFCK